MAALQDFERHVLPFVAGAPTPAVEDAVLDACIEFCKGTRLLRRIGDPLNIRAGRFEYELDAPDQDSQIVRIMTVWLQGRPLKSLTRPQVDALYPDGWVALTTGVPSRIEHFHAPAPDTFRLVPALDIDLPRGMVAEVAYAPSRSATEVPDRLLNEYAEEIASGAIARLHTHASAPYADASRAATYSTIFAGHISHVADRSTRGGAQVQLRAGRDPLL